MRIKYKQLEASEPMTVFGVQLIRQSISMYVLFLRQAYVVEGLSRKVEGLIKHTGFDASSVGPTRAPSALPITREEFAHAVQAWATDSFAGFEIEVLMDVEDYPEQLMSAGNLN